MESSDCVAGIKFIDTVNHVGFTAGHEPLLVHGRGSWRAMHPTWCVAVNVENPPQAGTPKIKIP
ncbi:MAG: hypothetical protein HZA70_00130 [Planctomycetes bacterium]|nr:hypothetical protein [Planctomycetota bacterium]